MTVPTQAINGTALRHNIIWIPLVLGAMFSLKFLLKEQKGIPIDYTVVSLGVNYFQFGAVSRGLPGSIIYLTGLDLVSGTYLVYFASLTLTIVITYFILRSTTLSSVALIPFVIIIGALLLAWSTWIGKTDMLIAALLMMAAFAAGEARLITASVCVAVGLAIHEEAAIYGLPLIAAILFDRSRYKDIKLRSGQIAGAIIVTSLIIYALTPWLPHSSPKTMVDTILSELPHKFRGDSVTDIALYNVVSGPRGVNTSLCVVRNNIHYFVHPFSAILMIGLTIFCLSGGRRLGWMPPALASIPPMTFLWVTGSDMSRWVTLSLLNVWIVCAVRNFAPVEDEPRWAWARVACAAVVLALLYPGTSGAIHLGENPLFAPSPFIEKAVEIVAGPPNISDFDHCDPTWRSLLNN